MSRIAWLAIRQEPHYRRDAFEQGLRRLGFKVQNGAPVAPIANDVLVTWNRYGKTHQAATAFEQRGLPVIVVENAYLADWQQCRGMYAMALNHHNGAGRWPAYGPERWQRLGVELLPWHGAGGEVVVLPQRGVGPPGVAMPRDWLEKHRRLGRVRAHPGQHVGIPLGHDLAKASAVVTWASGAAIKALALGVPVFYGLPKWIGAVAARPIADMKAGPLRDDARRQLMFERLAWAQWHVDEIARGDAIKTLLELPPC